MIEIGCLANFNNFFSKEVEFALKNNFKILQIWYYKNGIALRKDKDPIKTIKDSNFPSIIHAVLDINEFEEHIPKLIKILNKLYHTNIIIHPICKSEKLSIHTIKKLSAKVTYAYKEFFSNQISLYIENNSKLDPIFSSSEEIEFVFRSNPNVKLILDIAHIDNYDHLKKIVQIKMPEMLHIADKHFDIVHEHLPIGEGELDFKLIFSQILQGFNGKIILEIIQSKDKIISSRDIILSYL